MPFRIGLQLLKRDSDRQLESLAVIASLLQLIGVVPPDQEEPPDRPMPKGHVPTQMTESGLIWTPFGTPAKEISDAIRDGWPPDLRTDAARVSYMESTKWNPSAERNTLSQAGGRCGVPIGFIRGVRIVSEDSVGLFQVNVCAWPYTREQMLDPRLNARVGYEIYKAQGWGAWQFSADTLGLL